MREVEAYDYLGPDGALLYQVVRYEPKSFRQRQPDGNGGWTWSMDGVERVLYRLRKILAADSGRVVYVVEGEKDVHAIESAGLLATCNPGGAGKWRPEFSEALRDRNVIIFPDSDEPGRKHAQDVARALLPVAARVGIIDLGDHKDVSDLVASWPDPEIVATWPPETAQRMARSIGTAQEFFDRLGREFLTMPETRGAAEAPTYTPRLWSLRDLVAADFPPITGFLGESMLAPGTIGLMAGRRGAGKTYLTLKLGDNVSQGVPLGELQIRKGRVLIISQEMGAQSIQKRVIKLFGREPSSDMTIICKAPNINLDTDQGAANLRALIEGKGFDFVALDSLRDVKGSFDENSNNEMGELLVRLRDQVVEPTNVAFLLNHHFGKAVEGRGPSGRGASAIEDVCADVIYLTEDGDARKAVFDKARDSDREGSGFKYRIVGGDDGGVSVEILPFDRPTSQDDFELLKLVEAVEKMDMGSGVRQSDAIRAMSWQRTTGQRYVQRSVNLGMLKLQAAGRGKPNILFFIPKADR